MILAHEETDQLSRIEDLKIGSLANRNLFANTVSQISGGNTDFMIGCWASWIAIYKREIQVLIEMLNGTALMKGNLAVSGKIMYEFTLNQ